MNDELRKELDKLKGTRMSVKEITAQRVSFVFGNAEKADKGTKASVKKSLERAALV